MTRREEIQERMAVLGTQIRFLDNAEKNSDAAYSAYLRTVEPLKSEAFRLGMELKDINDLEARP
jgi:hypothetical protein